MTAPSRPRILDLVDAAGGIDEFLAALTAPQRALLPYQWDLWQRPLSAVGPREYVGQGIPPGDWTIWLVMAGAGSGKTRMGAEWICSLARAYPGCRIAAIGATQKDARETMAFGESGIVERSPPWARPHFSVTEQKLSWPNGSMCFLYSAENPEVLRGPQHHFAWLDEPAKMRRLQETYDLMFHRLRLGEHPRALLTTTPRRVPLLHRLVADPSCVVSRGSTRDNAANLPRPWLAKMLADYAGTTLGRQEIDGELFVDAPGALWASAWIESARIASDGSPDEKLAMLAARLGAPLRRIVVGVDPATTSSASSDQCGIVVAGLGRAPDPADEREHAYILEDGTQRASPDRWAREVVRLYRAWGADCVVAETTLGGETIPALIRMVDDTIRVVEKGGNRGKRTRAEPIAGLYEQGRIHHVGLFAGLEDELCGYCLDSPTSPNAMDAAVYALGELMLRERASFSFA